MANQNPDHQLFVYGTLAPGEINEHVLKPLNGRWQSATVRGTLHPEGWGASHGFPAMRLNPNAERVSGQLFSSPELADFWQQLDEFEGEAYRRAETQVQLNDGTARIASIYVLND